jgi:hypothetical protein
MSGPFSFRNRLVQCPRCRRQVAVGMNVCPHCDFHRVRKAEPLPAPEPVPVQAPIPVVEEVRLAETTDLPSRSMLVILLAMLATFRRRA